MIEWLKARMGERTTHVGLLAIGLAAALMTAAFTAPPERFGNVKEAATWIAEMLFVGGIGGFLWKERK